jgi:hypothetical protein
MKYAFNFLVGGGGQWIDEHTPKPGTEEHMRNTLVHQARMEAIFSSMKHSVNVLFYVYHCECSRLAISDEEKDRVTRRWQGKPYKRVEENRTPEMIEWERQSREKYYELTGKKPRKGNEVRRDDTAAKSE